MVFHPYQSNLLRSVVSQYRRGMDRHRNALGQAHHTVKLSAELGIALVVLPVYMVARASMMAGRSLRQAAGHRRFTKLSPQVGKLLDFSGFDVLDVDHSDSEPVGVFSNNSLPGGVSFDEIQEPAQPLFRALVAVGACLSLVQIKDLSERSVLTRASQLVGVEDTTDGDSMDGLHSGLGRETSWLMRWVSRWRTAARQLLSFDRAIFATDSSYRLGFGRGELSSPAKITGVASDLRTRSLILVLDYSAVWSGLSSNQQMRLQHQIATFLRQTSNSPLSKTRMPRFFSLAESVVRWMREDGMPDLGRLATIQCGEVSTSSETCDGIAMFAFASTVLLPAEHLCCERDSRQLSQDAIEADVVSATYVEHPLEKLLKRVDRILLWIERKWQLILQWSKAAIYR